MRVCSCVYGDFMNDCVIREFQRDDVCFLMCLRERKKGWKEEQIKVFACYIWLNVCKVILNTNFLCIPGISVCLYLQWCQFAATGLIHSPLMCSINVNETGYLISGITYICWTHGRSITQPSLVKASEPIRRLLCWNWICSICFCIPKT